MTLIAFFATVFLSSVAAAQIVDCHIVLTPEGTTCQCESSVPPLPDPNLPDPNCSHDLCTMGPALQADCGGCIATVCACDSYCCETKWDHYCVHEAQEICNLPCSSTGSCYCECPPE